jgi:cytochrome c nitrite reductase small subunit
VTSTRTGQVLLACLALGLLGSSPLIAQSLGAGYQAPKDYAIEWAGRISLLGVVASAGLIGYVLVFRRRYITAAGSQWMLFIGICIMPLPVMVLSSAVGLERAKDISFCASCHVMGHFVSDMQDPASGRLAAVHFKNRYIQRSHCYVCHTDYGLFGTLEAKLSGVGHIWKSATRSYTTPVRISRPYRFTICLDCHAQSAKFEAVAKHEGVIPKVLSGQAGCTSCHGLSHPAPEEREERRASR